MTLKKCSDYIRGWLPQEPNLQTYQRSMAPKTRSISWRILFVVLIFFVGLVSGLLGAFGVINDMTSVLISVIGLIAVGTEVTIHSYSEKTKKRTTEA